MRVISIVLLLTIWAAGCARKPPESPQPTPATTASPPPEPSAPAKPNSGPPPTTKGKTTPQTAKPSAPKPAPAKPTASAPAKPTAPRQAPTPPAAAAPRATRTNPSLDLDALEERLKSTKAIGLMTKLSLKNQVDDLLDGFRDHYAGKGKLTMPQLRQSYDLLMMKVLSLLQDKDKTLASDIVASRELIWALLADSKKFAALDA
jgi:hypothetical protein